MYTVALKAKEKTCSIHKLGTSDATLSCNIHTGLRLNKWMNRYKPSMENPP